ncbi:MAG: YbaB/EbfC family nucleoid-associated protein [Acidobacteria bacterium]|nr:MAG: YbaB/EbfC family nucleoid-associated protein [Acidobacteriota bacterium]
MDIQKMLEQAQRMQEELRRTLKEMRVEASAGGGMVKVVMSGDKQIVSLTIEPEASEDIEMLQDLIIAAVNECGRKVDEAIQQQALKNLNLPGLGGLA